MNDPTLTVEYMRQGNFTICSLLDARSKSQYLGVAFCNVTDTFNDNIGHAIALGRAMNDRAKHYAKAAYA